MPTTHYETEEELDDEFERIEELNYEHINLKEAVIEAEKDLKIAETELADFEEENREFLLN